MTCSFAICFFNVTPDLQLVLDYANEHEISCDYVDRYTWSIIGDKADVVLSARRGPVSGIPFPNRSHDHHQFLLLALSSADQEKVMENLDKLDQLRERLKKANGSTVK